MADAAGRLSVQVAEGVAVLEIVNPQRRNAMSLAIWRDLAAFAETAAESTDIRAVVLRGRGDVFSAGADISEFAAHRSGAARSYDDLVEEVCDAVEAIPQPTVAAIRGPCVGAGLSLAASCDLRIASEDAFFLLPAAKLGLGYDRRGIARLCRVFGDSLTRQLLFTAESLPARRAFDAAAVHALCPADDIHGHSFAHAQRIADLAPLTLRAAKLALRAISGRSELMAEAERLSAQADASADYAEGRAAFSAKTQPRFTGR